MSAPPPNRRCSSAERACAGRPAAARHAALVAVALAMLGAPPARSASGETPADSTTAAPAAKHSPPAPPSAPRAPVVNVVRRTEDEVMLLGVRLDQDELDAQLQTYPTPAGTLLPLSEFCAALEIGAEVDLPAGHAIVHGRSILQIDAVAGRARVGTRELAADPGELEVHADDIYVAAGRMAAWLDLDIAVDMASAVVVVRSPWRLPIQDRVDRRRQEHRLSEADRAGMPEFPRVRPPRALMTLPFVDLTLRTTRMDRPGLERWDYNSFAAGGLLYMDGDLQVQGNETNPLALLTGGLGRRDPDPGLLGPLRAREFRMGEVYTDGLPLVTLPMAGPGGAVSNLPLEQPSLFDRHVFRGRVPPGWDVELYRDENLVALRTSPADGEYQFDVPLSFGRNAFRLAFHGPRGERRDESHVYYVGPALTPPGHADYRVSVCQPRDRGPRAQAEADISLARRLSVSLAAAEVELDDGTRTFGTGGLRTSWGRTFASLDVAADGEGGAAVEGGIYALAGPFGVTLRRAALNRFRSEVFLPQVAPIANRTTARLDASLVVARARFSIQSEAADDGLVGGGSMLRLNHRTSFGLGALSLSHNLRRTVVEGGGPVSPPETRHTLFATAQARRWWLRGAMEYDPARPAPLVAMGLAAEGLAPAGSYAAVGIDRDAIRGETRASISLRHDQGGMGWSARTEHGRMSGTSVSLAIQMGIGRDPLIGRWHASAAPIATQGAAVARVFVDRNGNGRFDVGEPPVEGAALEVDSGLRPEHTGLDGTTYLAGLSENRPVALALSPASLEDPLWVPAAPGLSFVPRAGQVVTLDFPVRATGEIVGAVWMRERGAQRPLAGVAVELLDDGGAVVMRARAAYDGWYELSAVPPGSYRLRVAPADAARLQGLAGAPRAIAIPVDGTVITGADLVLERSDADVISGE